MPDTARYLGTTANKIRVLMGDGKLAYTQRKKNRAIVVSVADLIALNYPSGGLQDARPGDEE